MKRILNYAVRALSSESPYDLVVIGGGPGGYVASIKAAQLGMKVACVEKRGSLGGTCLNVGCIPSKSLLHASEIFDELHHMKEWGIETDETPPVDYDKLQETKNDVIQGLTDGVEFLFKKNKVDYFQGGAKITSAEGEVFIKLNEGGEDTIVGENIMLATGSDVDTLPIFPIDEDIIMSSTGALDLNHVPEKMAVIGTGAISLELGSVWSRFGTDVTFFYYREEVARYLDNELRPIFREELEAQGMKFYLDTDVVDCDIGEDSAILKFEDMNTKEIFEEEFDKVLVAVGRKPYFDDVGVEELGIELTPWGQIEVSPVFETSVKNIYAIGDCIPGPMLAHKAEEDGVMCVEYLHDGRIPHVDYDLVPSIVYTRPEVAAVGLRTQDLEDGTYDVSYKVGKFGFEEDKEEKGKINFDVADGGLVKIVSEKESGKVLGLHMIGKDVSEMIMEGAMIMKAGLTAKDIPDTCHLHNSLAEALKESKGKPF